MERPQLSAAAGAAGARRRRRAPGSFAGLFAPGMLGSTLLIWSSFFLLMFSFYFALSWTPKLLVPAGLSAQQGITGGVLLNIGGIVGGSLFGLLAARINLGWLTSACMLLTAVAMAAFGVVHRRPDAGLRRRVRHRRLHLRLDGRALRLRADRLSGGDPHHRHGLVDRHRPHRRDPRAAHRRRAARRRLERRRTSTTPTRCRCSSSMFTVLALRSRAGAAGAARGGAMATAH